MNVRLYSQDNTTEIPVGPDGLLGTADDATGGMTTDAAGTYRFGNLPQGQYRVRMTAPAGYASTRDTASTGTPNGNVDNDDNGPGRQRRRGDEQRHHPHARRGRRTEQQHSQHRRR